MDGAVKVDHRQRGRFLALAAANHRAAADQVLNGRRGGVNLGVISSMDENGVDSAVFQFALMQPVVALDQGLKQDDPRGLQPAAWL